ncbi:MAG: sigma factor-like helix-turn-helix DNA-binding protein, partial [bacterium]
YSIGVPTQMTLSEIGKKFNLTRERIRQVEAKALSKLKRRIVLRDAKEHVS